MAETYFQTKQSELTDLSDEQLQLAKKIILAVDPSSQTKTNYASVVANNNVFRNFGLTLKYNDIEIFKSLNNPKSDRSADLFFDLKISGDELPSIRELERAQKHRPKFVSVSVEVGSRALSKIVEVAESKNTTVVAELLSSTMKEDEIVELYGNSIEDIALRRFEIVRRSGCSAIMCEQDIAHVIVNKHGKLDNTKVMLTGVTLTPETSDHRKPIRPAEAHHLADLMVIGRDIMDHKDPVSRLKEYLTVS